MERIRVSPDQMDGVASRLSGQMGDWESNVGSIKNCITQLDSMWEGLGNQTFANLWQEDSQNFTRLQQLMSEYQQAITRAAAKFRETDQTVSGIVGRR